jgi:hypothetical protein
LYLFPLPPPPSSGYNFLSTYNFAQRRRQKQRIFNGLSPFRDRRVGKKGSLKWAKVTTTSHQMGKWGEEEEEWSQPPAGRL